MKWDDFKATWRGQKANAPKMNTQLAKITQVGLSTYASHAAAKFELEMKEITAVSSVAEDDTPVSTHSAPEPASTGIQAWAEKEIYNFGKHLMRGWLI